MAVKVLLVTASVCKIIENYFVLPYIFVHTCPNFLQLQIHFKFCLRILFYYCESMFQILTHALCIIRLLIQIRMYFIASAHHTKHFLRGVAFLFFAQQKSPFVDLIFYKRTLSTISLFNLLSESL